MKKAFLIFLIIFSLAFALRGVLAQTKVEYPEGFAVDSDLDGLTDEGEIKIFNTDPKNSDSDGDGYFDGIEILNKTNPLDKLSYVNPEPVKKTFEIAWPWYVTRATALASFLLLYGVIFLGLTVRLPFLNKFFSPLTSLKVHAWLSVQALIFVFVHGVSLIFDKFYKFSLMEVFIPFAHPEEEYFVAMGVIGFYIMIFLIISSYFRQIMSRRIWRISHFLNIVLYIIGVRHALNMGTDLSAPGMGRNIFIGANILLAVLFIMNLSCQLHVVIKRKIQEKKKVLPVQEIQ